MLSISRSPLILIESVSAKSYPVALSLFESQEKPVKELNGKVDLRK